MAKLSQRGTIAIIPGFGKIIGLSILPNDKIRNHLVANPINRTFSSRPLGAALYCGTTRTMAMSCVTSLILSCEVSLSSISVMSSSKLTADTKLDVDIGDMRIKYKSKDETFTEEQLVSKEPIGQFKAWFEEASKNPQIFEPNTMYLATVTEDGIPSIRPVLLKHYGKNGFKFYTNYESKKGRDIAQNSNVAAYFYWQPLRRGVRIEGKAVKTSPEDSDHYFQTRPYSSQIGSMCSKQSSAIASRETLIVKERELMAQFPEGQVKRPDSWGGYIIIPSSVEFWQGQSDRLHDRIRFRWHMSNEKIDDVLLHQGDNGWVYERLSP